MKHPNSESGSGSNLAKRLGAYSAVAAATASVTDMADAAEVVWTIPDMVVGDDPGLLFNMVTGVTNDTPPGIYFNAILGSMRLIGNYPGIASFTGAYIYTPASSTFGMFVADGTNASLLAAGVPIDENQPFGAAVNEPSLGNNANLNNWTTPEGTPRRGFAGIRFKLEGDSTHYGWADVTYNDALQTATLHAFGYNDTPDAASVPPFPIVPAITEIVRDTDANTVTLTWRKTGAESYVARHSTDARDWDGDLDDGILVERDENKEDEDHMTVTFPLGVDLQNELNLFFRIETEA